MKKEITIVINRSEITAGTRGASLGPDAIITAARNKKNPFFAGFNRIEVKNMNDLLDHPVKHPFAKRIEGLIEVYDSVSNTISNELKQGNFPLVMAGDHGSAGGTIAGIKKAFPDKRLGVIWIDAHADIHSPYTTPSGNMHGMPLTSALNDDNLQSKVNDVPDETISLWEELKSVGFKGAKILSEDLVFIGVRDTEEQENAIIKRLNIKVVPVIEVFEKGAATVGKEALDKLSNCDMIYVSFDVDSMDPKASSYGTGTPVREGLMPKQARDLLLMLAGSEKLVCAEIVEVNPCLDEKCNRMGELAFEMIEQLVNKIKE